MVTLLNRGPESAEMCHDSCAAQDGDKKLHSVWVPKFWRDVLLILHKKDAGGSILHNFGTFLP